MLCLLAVIVVYLIIDYTLIAFFKCLCLCLKDRHDPNEKGDVRDGFEQRYKHSNILGSYKMINNPDYKHTANIITELRRKAREVREVKGMEESMHTLKREDEGN